MHEMKMKKMTRKTKRKAKSVGQLTKRKAWKTPKRSVLQGHMCP